MRYSVLPDYDLRRRGHGEILTEFGAGFGLRIMGIFIEKNKIIKKILL